MWDLFVIRFHYGTFSRILQFITSHTFSLLQKPSRTVSHRLAPQLTSHFFSFLTFKTTHTTYRTVSHTLVHSTPSHTVSQHLFSWFKCWHIPLCNSKRHSSESILFIYLFLSFFSHFLTFSLRSVSSFVWQKYKAVMINGGCAYYRVHPWLLAHSFW